MELLSSRDTPSNVMANPRKGGGARMDPVGTVVGISEGKAEGNGVDGVLEGFSVIGSVGLGVDGLSEGLLDGSKVGHSVGGAEGHMDGNDEGTCVVGEGVMGASVVGAAVMGAGDVAFLLVVLLGVGAAVNGAIDDGDDDTGAGMDVTFGMVGTAVATTDAANVGWAVTMVGLEAGDTATTGELSVPTGTIGKSSIVVVGVVVTADS